MIVKIRVDVSGCFKSLSMIRKRSFNYDFLKILIGVRTIKRKKEKKKNIIMLALKILPRNEAR